MNYDLQQAKQYVATLDKERIALALLSASTEFKHIFQLLPLLLHFNRPDLPGYIADCPTGIAHFHLSDYQRDFLATACQGLATQALNATSKAEEASPCINGVYVMGSIASITQTSQSDLDIWVCHQENLPSSQRNKLLEKLTALQSWAKTFQIDVNFFLMDQKRFRFFHYVDALSEENSGSAQHLLLLDEFYRSTIRLAGKPLLWLHLAIEQEQDYDAEVQRLVQQKQLNLDDWVDFGGLGQLSANEYLGATLWQLYKGIDSPYKAVIKILLLEAYSWEYPKTKLIAVEFKQRLLAGDTAVTHFDSYLAMLAKVSDYLKQIKDDKRLNFVRQCFYVKANMDYQTDLPSSWRAETLSQLIKSWQWSKETTDILNARDSWKIKQVKRVYNELVQVLMLSYRNLVNFAHKHKVDDSIMPQDISILTRKLYTAFEELAGKVTLLNPQISKDLSEQYLTFIEVKNSRSFKDGWYVVNQAPKIMELSKLRYVEYDPNLHKLVAWAYFNGLLTAKTQLAIASPNVSIEALRQFVTDLRLSFAVNVPPATNEDLYQSCEIKNLMMVVNLVSDPTKQLYAQQLKNPIRQSDLFSFGPEQQSLVGSIDFIYRNLWNEVRTLHFEGSTAILAALKTLTNKIHKNSQLPPIHLYCYSRHYHQELKGFILSLIKKCLTRQNDQSGINLLRVAGRTWQLFFVDDRCMDMKEVKPNAQVLTSALEENSLEKEEQAALYCYPEEINNFASEGFLQFFFEDNADQTFNVYILDELNHLEIYRHCQGRKEAKIKEINYIYTSSGIDKQDNPYNIVQHNFNYPQFYQILKQDAVIHIRPFHSRPIGLSQDKAS